MMNRWRKAIDRLIDRIGRIIAWLSVAMVLLTAAVVVLRYGISTSFTAMQELITWMHATLFMLGCAWALQHDVHVRVDILYRKFKPLNQCLVNLFGNLFLLLPFCAFLFWVSASYVLQSWQLREHSAETDGLPALYLLKTLIPLLSLTMMLQGVANILGAVTTLTKTDAAPPPSHSIKENESS